jgi:hypothetical protein
MGWFRKRRQQDAKEEKPDETIALIGARLTFLEALTSQLVAELPPERRNLLLEQLQEVVGGLIVLPPPKWVPPSREQDFRDELRRRIRVLIEHTTNLKTGPP